jgi:rhodanese-related sulfurtransferase
MLQPITRDELIHKIRFSEHFYLVEALSESYFVRSHLPGAINIPADHVAELAPKFLPDKYAEIVTYCMSPT